MYSRLGAGLQDDVAVGSVTSIAGSGTGLGSTFWPVLKHRAEKREPVFSDKRSTTINSSKKADFRFGLFALACSCAGPAYSVICSLRIGGRDVTCTFWRVADDLRISAFLCIQQGVEGRDADGNVRRTIQGGNLTDDR